VRARARLSLVLGREKREERVRGEGSGASGAIGVAPHTTTPRKPAGERKKRAAHALSLTLLPLSLMVLYIIGLGLCDEKDITVR